MESGLTLAQARWVINQRADLVEKLDELFPRDEVGICWEKGQDEWTLQTGNSTPDTGSSTSATNAANANSSTSSSTNTGNAPGTAGKRSVASQLVDMARRGYTLGVSDDGTPYGTEPGRSHIALPLRGGKLGLRVALARRYYDTHHVVASSQALANACTVLEGYAAQMPPRPLHLRIAGHDDKVYIDTADANDRVIVIHGGTWSFASGDIPVMFRRTELTASMPDPVHSGDLGKLWEYVRIAEADRPILLAVLVAALIQPDVPHVILAFLAEHGCAKSSSARYVVSLIDPSTAPLQMPPRDVDGWVTTANGARVVALDNLSGIPDWLSDALCRAATGEGHTKRQLYTDADLTVIRFRRVIILNGIDLGGLRGDLTDRLAPVDLIRITDTDRRDEAELATAWEQDRPAILGGLLDLATQVHARLPTFTMDKLPRMADFARVLACIDDICGTQGVWQYGERAKHQAADGLEADPFIARLMAMNFTCTDESASVILARARRGLILVSTRVATEGPHRHQSAKSRGTGTAVTGLADRKRQRGEQGPCHPLDDCAALMTIHSAVRLIGELPRGKSRKPNSPQIPGLTWRDDLARLARSQYALPLLWGLRPPFSLLSLF